MPLHSPLSQFFDGMSSALIHKYDVLLAVGPEKLFSLQSGTRSPLESTNLLRRMHCSSRLNRSNSRYRTENQMDPQNSMREHRVCLRLRDGGYVDVLLPGKSSDTLVTKTGN
jgi:hypothetical protein